ncbi:MAG: outer membrane protein assembly factor BamD [Ignavibacteria bacterium]|nr:outer membrane protein assembly factor BamD [Ignavibacteria bacterium]
MKIKKSLKFTIILLFTALIITGCGGSKDSINTDDPLKAFDIAKRKYDKKEYVDAIDDFSFIKIRFPGTEISDKVQYFLAASYFYQKEFILAAYEYESFLKNYPLSPLMPDAKYMLGNTYYSLSPKYSLDQQFTTEALNQLLSFVETYPQDKKVSEAETKIKELRNKLAYKDFWIAELYMKTDNYKAASLYYQAVYDNYIDSDWADDAMVGQAEAFINGRRYDDAKKVLEKFYKLFPNSNLKTRANRLTSKINELQAGK